MTNVNRLVWVNVLLALALAPLLILLVVQGKFPPLITTLLSVLTAGTLGATLCNLRGVFSQYRDTKGEFPAYLIIPYYVRSLTGMLTGLLSFFIGSLLVSSLSIDATTQGWETLEGRLPYIGFAILAGFAAQEFMVRMKLVADTLFAERLQEDEYARLEKLAELHKAGVIDDEEFKAKKRDVLRLVVPTENQGLPNEGRRASLAFDVQYYLATYLDLQEAFGTDYSAAFDHWVIAGSPEGRSGAAP